MSELIELHEADDGLVKTLARALRKTGPLIHGAYCWSGRVKNGKYTVEKAIKRPRRVGDSTKVVVPYGMFPELSASEDARSLDAILIERCRGYIEALESGAATTGNPEGVESLAESLETLADDLRLWERSRAMGEVVERLKDQLKSRSIRRPGGR